MRRAGLNWPADWIGSYREKPVSTAMPEVKIQPGMLYERDGKRREVVRIIPEDRFTSTAVEWRRPGQEFRSSACSVSAWLKWVKDAQQIS